MKTRIKLKREFLILKTLNINIKNITKKKHCKFHSNLNKKRLSVNRNKYSNEFKCEIIEIINRKNKFKKKIVKVCI